MPQRNFSNKVSLPKLPGLQFPVALSTPRTQPSGAGLRRGAVSGMASRGRARPAPERVGPGRPALRQRDHATWPLRGFFEMQPELFRYLFLERQCSRDSLLLSPSVSVRSIFQKWLCNAIRNSFFLRFSYSTMSSFGVKDIPHEHAQGECFLSEPYNPVLCQNNV